MTAPVAMACGMLRPVFLLIWLMRLFGFLFMVFDSYASLIVRDSFGLKVSDLHDLLLLGLQQGIELVRVGLVTLSSSFSRRSPSSSPISPSLTALSMVSLALRRMLRTATLPSSALPLASLTYSLRRSSVSSGMVRRMTLPSRLGLCPDRNCAVPSRRRWPGMRQTG